MLPEVWVSAGTLADGITVEAGSASQFASVRPGYLPAAVWNTQSCASPLARTMCSHCRDPRRVLANEQAVGALSVCFLTGSFQARNQKYESGDGGGFETSAGEDE